MMALLLTAELLSFQPQSSRANLFLEAFAKTAKDAGVRVTHTTRYHGGSDLLLFWGPGDPSRFDPMRRQLEAGGHVAVGDLAYWDREKKFRVSIDAAHPQAWVMKRTWPDNRWQADGVVVRDLWDVNGPVIVAGLGSKARVQYGAGTVDQWEHAMMAQVKAAGRTVIYRGKKDPTQAPIEKALKGVSAVITWHSNVAVDAIRMGIPAVCRDGAAAAVCGSEYTDQLTPLDTETRRVFLTNLAYFQWTMDETTGCWRFLRELLA